MICHYLHHILLFCAIIILLNAFAILAILCNLYCPPTGVSILKVVLSRFKISKNNFLGRAKPMSAGSLARFPFPLPFLHAPSETRNQNKEAAATPPCVFVLLDFNQSPSKLLIDGWLHRRSHRLVKISNQKLRCQRPWLGAANLAKIVCINHSL